MKFKTFKFSELQVELLKEILKNRLNKIKNENIDNFEYIENKFSLTSLINIIEETPWSYDKSY